MRRFVLGFICIVLGTVVVQPVFAHYRYTFTYDALNTSVNGHSYPQDSLYFVTPVILDVSTMGQYWGVPSGEDINGFHPTTFGVNGYGGSGTGAYLSFSSNFGSSSEAGEIRNLNFRAYNPLSPGTYPAVPNSAGRGIYMGSGSTSWFYTSGSLTIERVSPILWQHGTGYLAAWYMNGATMTSSTLLTPNQVADTGWKVVGRE